MTLKNIKDRYNEYKTHKMSEIDTQVLFVEPILMLANCDIMNPDVTKRVSPAAQGFDLEIYENISTPPKVKIAVECKSIVR